MTPTRKLPLFLVSGASCVGKSSLCEVLFRREQDFLVLESDLLWRKEFDTPETQYREFRETWLRVCANVAQIGLPVVLCGCVTPEQIEPLPERALFSSTHYLAAVCSDAAMRRRLTLRGVTDPAWIESSMRFNRWLRENGETTEPGMTLLDTTELTIEEAARKAEGWVRTRLQQRPRRSAATAAAHTPGLPPRGG